MGGGGGRERSRPGLSSRRLCWENSLFILSTSAFGAWSENITFGEQTTSYDLWHAWLPQLLWQCCQPLVILKGWNTNVIP